MDTAPPLYAHQRASVAFIYSRERSFDASDPGTGKTRSAITAFAARRGEGAGCALILAPKSLLRTAWQDDFTRFAPHLTTSVALAANREKAFKEDADVYITNIDAVNWLVKQPPAFWKRFRNGMLIVDESSAFKHHTSARSKAINKIKQHFPYRHLMTGTPNSNTITDLWNQINILDDGRRLGTSFFSFRNSVCDPKQVGPMPNMVKWTDREGVHEIVGKLIEDLTIRHQFESCIDIPPNALTIRNYYLSPQQLRAYKEMEQDAVTQAADGKLVNAVNGAVVMTKLLQIASGAAYTETHDVACVDTGRYELVADLVEEREHSLVFFLWGHQRDALIAAFEARGISYTVIDGSTGDAERAAAVRNYQAGFYKVLLAHPQSAAHGLTLTRGTATIWASPTYNLEHWLQGNRRIYRAGQTQRTETILITAPGTIEEKVAETLQAKDERQMNLLNMLELPNVLRRKFSLP